MPKPRPGIKSKPTRQLATPEQQDEFVGKAPVDPDNAPPDQNPTQGTAKRKMGRPRKPKDPKDPKPRRVSPRPATRSPRPYQSRSRPSGQAAWRLLSRAGYPGFQRRAGHLTRKLAILESSITTVF